MELERIAGTGASISTCRTVRGVGAGQKRGDVAFLELRINRKFRFERMRGRSWPRRLGQISRLHNCWTL
jgi:hypothetical protein